MQGHFIGTDGAALGVDPVAFACRRLCYAVLWRAMLDVRSRNGQAQPALQWLLEIDAGDILERIMPGPGVELEQLGFWSR